MPGTSNFARVTPMGKEYLNDAKMPDTVLTMTELCNSDPSAPIRFALTDKFNRVFNAFDSTVAEML